MLGCAGGFGGRAVERDDVEAGLAGGFSFIAAGQCDEFVRCVGGVAGEGKAATAPGLGDPSFDLLDEAFVGQPTAV